MRKRISALVDWWISEQFSRTVVWMSWVEPNRHRNTAGKLRSVNTSNSKLRSETLTLPQLITFVTAAMAARHMGAQQPRPVTEPERRSHKVNVNRERT